MTDDQLREWKELAEKATPGPWGWYSEDASMATLCSRDAPGNLDPGEGHVLSVTICKNCQEGDHWQWGRCYTANADDAAFLAASRTAVPLLCEEVGRLKEALREHVIFQSADNPKYGTCNNCAHEWWDGIETHSDKCALSTTG